MSEKVLRVYYFAVRNAALELDQNNAAAAEAYARVADEMEQVYGVRLAAYRSDAERTTFQ